ncbi:MAG: O-antigen ligase family protein [Opitutaceae bacterium]
MSLLAEMDASPEVADPASASHRFADQITAAARWIFWVLGAGILGVTPWLMGGNNSAGYYWTLWIGRASAVPLALWLGACLLRKRMPGAEFWVPVTCWTLLAAQIIASTYNPSSRPVLPWLGHGFDPLPHNPHWPSTAFRVATVLEAHFWLGLGLLALTARNLGLSAAQLRGLLWILAGTTAILALVGIPFKFSGEMLILGRWKAPEWYFYSTFLYHNHWCAFALLGISATVALFVAHQNCWVRAALAVMGGAIAASAPLSTSRLGTLAMAGFIIVIIVAFARQKWMPRSRTFSLLIAGGLLGAVAVGAGVFYLYKSRGAPAGHRTWAKVLSSNPFGSRQMIAEDTIPMIRDKPWFGWGLSGFGGGFRFYQRPETRIVYNQGRITLCDHAHNDWLERLVEFGFIGFSLFIAPGVVWFRIATRLGPRGLLEHWTLIGCVAVMVFALGDMAFINRAVAASFALLFPLSLRPNMRVTGSRR